MAPLPRNLLDAVEAAGVDTRALAARLSIAPPALEEGLSFAEADRFLCAAWELLDDPGIGLQAGCLLRPERFGVVGIAAMSSPNFGVAVQRKARYSRLIWGDDYQVHQRGGEALVVLAPSGPVRPYTQGKIDLELASLLTFGRRFTGVHLVPLRVTLRRAAPAWRARYDEVFGCPVLFAQEADSIVFSQQDFELPLLSRNAQLAALVAGGAEEALARQGSAALHQRVGQVIDGLLEGDEPALSAVARQLCMSERTLQRRLARERLRFTDLLDQRRQLAAKRHLAGSPATADEVAFLLGFATTSSFFRAFKRWTGQTPEGWRRALRPSPAAA